MKISKELFTKLREAVEPFDTENNRCRYRNGSFPRAELTRDVNMRFRWDCFQASGINTNQFYADGLNDEHIDTALRAIIPPL